MKYNKGIVKAFASRG